MLARALWTGLFALFAWIPIGRVESHAVRAQRVEGNRALFVVSAIDAVTDSPARVAESASLPRQLAPDRKPNAPHGLARHSSDVERVERMELPAWRPPEELRPTGWRGFLAERLILPHDATAPPPQRS